MISKIIKIDEVNYDGKVYNFHCKPNEVYFANGILVHNCYAKYNAVKRFKTLKAEDWHKEVVEIDKITKKFPKKSGTVMFPTQHDITPTNLEACLTYLKNMLDAGNNVLIVSKPHYQCIKAICEQFEKRKNQILFRFTIGASNDDILKYWEPGAPSFDERMDSLAFAYLSGFRTSISMEPVLDWENLISNFKKFAPFVTDSIWIGTMNYVDKRVEIKTDEDRKRVAELVKWHTLDTYKRIYEELKDHPLIKWKESLKEALGLEIPDKIGLDI